MLALERARRVEEEEGGREREKREEREGLGELVKVKVKVCVCVCVCDGCINSGESEWRRRRLGCVGEFWK